MRRFYIGCLIKVDFILVQPATAYEVRILSGAATRLRAVYTISHNSHIVPFHSSFKRSALSDKHDKTALSRLSPRPHICTSAAPRSQEQLLCKLFRTRVGGCGLRIGRSTLFLSEMSDLDPYATVCGGKEPWTVAGAWCVLCYLMFTLSPIIESEGGGGGGEADAEAVGVTVELYCSMRLSFARIHPVTVRLDSVDFVGTPHPIGLSCSAVLLF
jgi:hypothetical protein